jgi:queuine tRNA-ribosyltransferase
MSRLAAALVIIVQMFVSSAFQTRTATRLHVPRGALRLSVFGRRGLVRPMVSRAEDADTSVGVSEDDSSQSPEKKASSRHRRDYVEYPPPPDPSEFPDWAYEPRDFFRFEILHESTKSQARVGRIHTPHGIIDTPGFVAVATNAALKGVDFPDADQAGQQLIFSNTYHLLLHPGADIIGEAGGIHKWTNRTDRPFITDSGGFQVFSLAYGSVHEELSSKGELKRADGGKNKPGKDAVKVTEDGAIFRSYRDGSKFLLTPETTVQAQKKIGADIIIPLDELPGYYVDRARLEESVERTHRWEARSLQEHLKDVKDQAMYCVSINKEYRGFAVKSTTLLTLISLSFVR